MLLMPKLNKSRVVMLEQNKSLIVDAGTKQKTFCRRSKTKSMLLMPDENKSHFFHVGAKPKALLLKLKQNKSMVTNIFTISHLIYGILY